MGDKKTKNIKNKNTPSIAEVSTSTGWVLFILSILVALFVGGAIRSFTSSQNLSHWFYNEFNKEAPPFVVEFDQIRLSLAKGWWPRFGLEFLNLRVRAKDTCVTASQIHIDNFYIPLSVLPTLQRQVKLGRVEVQEMSLILAERQSNCQNLEARSEQLVSEGDKSHLAEHHVGKASTSDSIISPENPEWLNDWMQFIRTRWKHELANTRKWLDGAYIHKLLVRWDADPHRWLGWEKLHVDLRKAHQPVRIRSWLRVAPELSQDASLAPIFLTLTLDEALLEWTARAQYKEGRLQLAGTLDLASTEFEVNLKGSHLPVGALLTTAQNWSLPVENNSLPWMWLTTEWQWQGNFYNYFESPIELKTADITGELGKIRLVNGRLKFDSRLWPSWEQPAEISIEGLALEHVAQALKVTGWEAVFPNLGLMSARGQLGAEGLELTWSLDNLEILFSKNARRWIQNIESLQGDLQWKPSQKIYLNIYGADILEGNFVGRVQSEFSEGFREGAVKVNIDSLQFAPKVQELLIGGRAEPMQIQIELIRQNHFWKSGQGNIRLSGVEASSWKLNEAHLAALYHEGHLEFKVAVDSMDVAQSNVYLQSLQRVEEVDRQFDQLRLKAVQLNIQADLGSGGTWTHGLAHNENSMGKWESSGKWHRDGQLKGWLQLSAKGNHIIKWNVSGRWPLLEVHYEDSQAGYSARQAR